jgi:N-acetylglucosamine-6-sulfatase
MLYRLRNGNLAFPADKQPRVAVLLCGTNNYVVTKSAKGEETWDLGIDTPPADVAEGVRAVAQMFRKELPATRVIVLGILLCKQAVKQAKVAETNVILAGFTCPKDEIVFMDLKDHYMNEDGTLKEELYTDGTHLTPEGYTVLAGILQPEIERLMALGPIRRD